ncbi:MAG: hypothetical protein M0C28_28420 [Candidatus Moduliflexus flocculans]|nr:hypothetical protein [Candidatus Moduliflexus flocculans]
MVTALMNALLGGVRHLAVIYVLGMFLSNILVGWVALEICALATAAGNANRSKGRSLLLKTAHH